MVFCELPNATGAHRIQNQYKRGNGFMHDGIVVTQDHNKIIWYSLGALVMCIASLLIILDNNSFFLLKLIGCIGVICFGYGIYFIIRQHMQEKPILIVDETGILDNSSAVSFGFIPWDDVRDISTRTVWNHTFIEVELVDAATYLEKLPLIKKKAVQANLEMGHQVVCITLGRSRTSVEEVLPQMMTLFEQAKRDMYRKQGHH